MNKIGLVLEGGGMRTMFTAGVLDYFLEQKLAFAAVIGVSAGAVQAVNYVAQQPHRTRDIALTFINDKRYCSWQSYRQTGDMFNVKFAYYEIPQKYFKFDHQTFNRSKTKLWVVATDVVKGEAKYLRIKKFIGNEIEALRASASLPMVSNLVKYQGRKYLDGGLTDAIPLKKLESLGYQKNVVILTRSTGYQKKASRFYLVTKRRYRQYPALIKAIKNRHLMYNATIDYLESQAKAGQAFIISPDQPLKVGRIEKNKTRLKTAYQEGYETAKRIYPALIDFMK